MTNRTRVGFHRLSLLTRVVSFILCCTVLLAFYPFSEKQPQDVHAETIDELEQEKADLAAEQERLEAQRNETAQTLEEQKVQSDILRQQITAKSSEIAINLQMITALDAQIADKETRIAEQETLIADLEQEITEKFEMLRVRLRSIAQNSTASTYLQLLFGSDTYVDYLISFKLSERIAANDQKIMDSLERDKQIVAQAKAQNEKDKADLETERTQLAVIQAELEESKTALQTLYAESEALADQMAQNIDYLNEQIDAMDKKQNDLQNRIDDILEQIKAEEDASGSSGSFMSGTMMWPAPTCKVITSSFKYRPQFGRYHKGVDIALYGDAEGEPIVAAADGTVVYSNRYDTWGGGYGLHVMIDHGYDSQGRRILTVYAHASSVSAYEGQVVKAGDYLAAVGNTGNSFGAHLHFEVRVDGTAVDPVANGYLSTSGIDVLG